MQSIFPLRFIFLILFILCGISMQAHEINVIHSTPISTSSIQEDAVIDSRNLQDVSAEKSQPESSTLCIVVMVEILVSILVFLKLGSEYLKSNKPYLPNTNVSLQF